jgi:CubicO group peptidase (beta-lactamase class C family)
MTNASMSLVKRAMRTVVIGHWSLITHSLIISLLIFAATGAAENAPAFRDDKLRAMDAAIALAIEKGDCPGGVLWLEQRGTAYHKAYGARAVEPVREEMTEDTIFDAASLTKVEAATPAVMKLVEQGRIELGAPASKYWPEFCGAGKEAITIRQLLTHTSGLRPDLSLVAPWSGTAKALELICAEALPDAPDTKFRYSDINLEVLGVVVQRVSGKTLDEFCAKEIFTPLGMRDTMFRPPDTLRPRIAPTERGVERGVVHDPTARRMDGVAGHAGLFTTAGDLARYARMLVHGGELDGVRLFKKETVELMTSVQSPPKIEAKRGLGWDIDSPFAGQRGEVFPIGGYGHTGWTGGSLWIDPGSETFVIFLSNRNHPTEKGDVRALRKTLGTLAAEAVQR